MSKTYRPYDPDQILLLPPSLREWLPAGHLAHFLADTVERLELSAITSVYEREERGNPPYHPVMMCKVWLYAYSVGLSSSRKIERLVVEDIAFRMLAANNRPDFRTLADFRKRHLAALESLFHQVLKLCQRAGLVKLGHVAIDSSKMKANASKHKAMSYARMKDALDRLLREDIKRWFDECDRVDAEEDKLYGKDKRGDELPEDLQDPEKRRKKIEEALRELEREAKEESEARDRKIAEQQREDPKAASKLRKKSPTPEPKAQKNFTDPESRIMPAPGEKTSFIQGYNCQTAVDDKAQVIVAADVSQQSTDSDWAVPMVEQVAANTGHLPRKATMDAGFFSGRAVEILQAMGVDPYICPERQKHSDRPAAPRGRIPAGLTMKERMRRKLATKRGRAVYALRKSVVEPVFGQIKQTRGFRQFLLRGLRKVKAEWSLICTGHNILKLWRAMTLGPPRRRLRAA